LVTSTCVGGVERMIAPAIRSRCASIGLCLGLAAAVTFGGCSSGKSESMGGALSGDASFAACANTPAAGYHAGWVVASTSGAYAVTIQSAMTLLSPSDVVVDEPEVGSTTLTIAVAKQNRGPDGGAETDAGAESDAGTPVDDGFSVTATSLPWMPEHRHGASVLPTVNAAGGGVFTVSQIEFFMAGTGKCRSI
jgi:hypothetical protein